MYGVAAGLFWSDIRILLLLYPLLIAPAVLARFSPLPSAFAYLVESLVDLSFLYFIARRWADKFSNTGVGFHWKRYLIVAAVGLLALLPIELAIWGLQFSMEVQPFAAFIFVGLLILWADAVFKYYFFFMPVVLGATAPRRIIALARGYTTGRGFLLLRVLFGPTVITLLLWSLLRLPSPDVRLLPVEWALLAAAKVFWVLCAYLSTAAGVIFLGESEWSSFRMQPYRSERLETLQVRAPRFLCNALTPRWAVRLLVIGVVVEMANMVTLQATPPGPAVAVSAIAIDDHKLTLTLSLNDPRYKMRGFNPFYLRLAGANAADIVSILPSRIEMQGAPLSLGELAGRTSAGMKVEFKTDRNADGLKDLKDLHLWYLGTRLTLLEMHKAQVNGSAGKAHPGEAAPPPAGDPARSMTFRRHSRGTSSPILT